MSKTELKRCPFCDGTAILIQNPTTYGNVYHYVSCIECGNRTKLYKSPKTAEKKWNRRNDEEIIIISRSEIDALNEYEEMIKKAKVIMPDVAEGKWIPAEERLPEKQCEYLCCCIFERFPEHKFYKVLDYYLYDQTPHFQHEGGITGLKVTHWMPLPEPPKAGDE